jgi:hypothetical protein
MAIDSLVNLLKRIPSFYNKKIGGSPVSTPINIPSAPGGPLITVGTTDILSGSSNLVETMSAVSFNLDLLLNNIQTIKDISYVGDIPVILPTQDQFVGSINLPGSPNVAFGGITQDAIGDYYVTENLGHCFKVDGNGNILVTYGFAGVGPGSLAEPLGIALDNSSNVIVVDAVKNKLVSFPNGGGAPNWEVLFGTDFPVDVLFNTANNLIYVLIYSSQIQIRTFNTSGVPQNTYTNINMSSTQKMCFDSQHNLFVSDNNGKIIVFDNTMAFVTTFLGPNYALASNDNYFGITAINEGVLGTFLAVMDTVSRTIKLIQYTQLASPHNFSIVGSFGSFGTGAGQFTGLDGSLMTNLNNQVVFVDIATQKLLIYGPNAIINSGPMFSGYLEYTAFPGNIFQIPQNTFSTFNYLIPSPQNLSNPIYVFIQNIGIFPLRAQQILIQPGNYQVFNWRPETLQWIPLNVTGYDNVNNTLTTVNPLNAVIVPGPIFPGFTSPDLDPLGANFGVTRIISEDDATYKKRIIESVTGSKMVASGIINQFRVIYGIKAQVYDWYPSSYAQLVTYLNAHPGFTAFYLDGSQVTVGFSPLDLTATQGPPTVFYVVLSGSGILTVPNGVYSNDLLSTPPDWSFIDYEDTTIGLSHHGGFFVPNIGEPDFSISNSLERYLHLISVIKAAGTEAIVILSP